MGDQVITNRTPGEVYPPAAGDVVLIKRISWPAIFSGVLVALATELLFLAFGLFIGFKLSSPGGINAWSTIWYFITCFFSLLFGGWVASRLSGNMQHGALHGIVVWGLATVATFAFGLWLSWGVVTQGLGLVKTAAVTTAAVAPSTMHNVTPNEADRMATEANRAANQAEQQAPSLAATAAHDVSTVSLRIWIGILIAICGAMLGGAIGAPKLTAAPPPAPAR